MKDGILHASALDTANQWHPWLQQLSEGRCPEPPSPALIETLRQHCQGLENRSIDAQPVGRPCPWPAGRWHGEKLCDALMDASLPAQARQARLAYHARWILRLSEPEDPRWHALVSVIIPVFNRAELVCEAIASALAQTHPKVEVIVVDDGSSDDLVERLEVFGDRVRLLRQLRQGVSQARNMGLAIARGDYVNFLDSDDLLDPDWLAAAMAAFGVIADADLCYAPARHQTYPQSYVSSPQTALLKFQPLHGGPGCLSHGMLPSSATSPPFLMLGVVMARWRAVEIGGFDPALTCAEDIRFWFRLALENSKVIGLRRLYNQRRLLPCGLSSSLPADTKPGLNLINLVDLLQRVDLWPQVPALLQTLLDPAGWRALEASANASFQQAGRRVKSMMTALSPLGRPSGHSPRPVLLALQQWARSLPHHCQRPAAELPLAARLLALAEQALAHCPPSTGHDLRLWLGDREPPPLTADTLLTLVLMRDGHWWNLDRPAESFWQELQRALPAPSPRPPVGADVVGRPAPLPALAHHHDALLRLCGTTPSAPARQRLAYHADWILSLLSPASNDHATGPLVSVIIPVFNRSDSIAEAVNSCLVQTYSNLEVLVIDDGSDEDIGAALQPVLKHIRLLRQEPNRGASAARNLGIEQASGSLIHFLDSDDLLAPDAIARKIAALQAIPDADLVFSGARQLVELTNDDHETPRPYLLPPRRARHCPTQNLLNTACRHYPFLTSTILVARWRLVEAGLFDPNLCRGEDQELFLRLALRRIKVIGIRSLTTLRRRSERSLTARPISDLELSRYHLRCLISLLETPGRGGRFGSRLIHRHLRATSLPLVANDPDACSERWRQALLAAMRTTVEEATAGSTDICRLLVTWHRRLRAILTLCPEIASNPWVQALAQRSHEPQQIRLRNEPPVRSAPGPGTHHHRW